MPWRLAAGAAALVALLLSGCRTHRERAPPRAVHGVVDLREWDFARDGSVPLEGEWSLFWAELVDDARAGEAREPTAFATVPGSWSEAHVEGGRALPLHGYATYRLRVLLRDVPAASPLAEPGALAVATYGAQAAHRLIVRDEAGALAARPVGAGVVGRDSAETRSAVHSTMTAITATRPRELTLYLQVSDFETDASGLHGAPTLAMTDSLVAARRARVYREFTMMGTILMMVLYHLLLFLLRRAERAPLYFALFCAAILARTFLYGHYVEELVPSLRWAQLDVRLEYLAIFGGASVFALFTRALFPRLTSVVAVRVVLLLSAVAALGELFLSATNALYFERTYELLIPVMAIWIMTVLVRAGLRDGDRQAKLMLVGFVVLTIAIVNDIGITLEVWRTPSLTAYGLFAFLLVQSLLLAMSNQGARNAAEAYARALDASRTELRAKNEQLERLDQLKDSFLANTSHELRTPLHGIVGLAESMLDGAAGALTAVAAKNVRMIVSSARRLTSLVNDLLDFSKLKHRTIELHSKAVDLRTLTELVLTMAAPLRGKKEIALENRVPESLSAALGDENRLQQILFNLVGNAIKFTNAGEVVVSAEREGGKIAVTVSDTGIGIPVADQARIFESFEQIDGGAAREHGGTGLGLTITKQLVLLHGGEIRVASEPAKGSRFTFTVPLTEDAATTTDAVVSSMRPVRDEVRPAPIPPPSDPSSGSHPVSSKAPSTRPSPTRPWRVLAVDDDPVNLAVLDAYLASSNFSVSSASNGIQALAILEKDGPFDVVLLDVMMPKMTGYAVCRKIRESHPANELPVVLLTAKDQVSDLVLGFDAGANDYLAKPFAKKELLARILAHTSMAKTNIAYRKFVPHELVRLLGRDNVTEVRLGDQVERKMTILFSDIRLFTTLSEAMSPREAFDFVNDHLKRMGPSVRACGGFIDKYIGDAIMALFPRCVDDAVRAALAMLAQVHAVVPTTSGTEAVTETAIAMGIGIHTGEVVLGVLGEEQRMEGTVIADAVNVAARVEGCTKVLGAALLLTGEAFAQVDDRARYGHRALGSIRVKGKSRALEIIELFDGDPPHLRAHKAATVVRFDAALATYRRRAFDEASREFAAMCELDASDGPARFYLAHCRRLVREGVGADWDGTIALDSK
jgi:two-component system sensor histidine kinase ChiS